LRRICWTDVEDDPHVICAELDRAIDLLAVVMMRTAKW
jgi:hypothetical protein